MLKKTTLVLILYLLSAYSAFCQDQKIAGTVQSSIPSLTADEYEAYKTGNEMGLARVAELNNYPGPMQVLELEKQLKLSSAQKIKLKAAYEAMKFKAVEMGGFILQQEKKLNDIFASGKADEGNIIYYTNKIGLYQGELRNAYLQAHLKTKRILTPDQVRKYNKLQTKN